MTKHEADVIGGLNMTDQISNEAYKQIMTAAQDENEVGDVLDKIRAEINTYGSIWVQYEITGHTDRDIQNIVENVLKQAKEQVIDIIDKYAEMEADFAKDINVPAKDVLEKIMKLQTYKMYEGENTVYVERDDVLQIFDNYAESEDKT